MVMDDRPDNIPEDDKSWDLPFDGTQGVGRVRLTQGELYVLDWVLSTGSQLLLSMTLDEVMVWKEFRLKVWTGILDSEHEDNNLGVMTDITFEDAEILLAAVPTQMTWGDGVDYGQMLKRKLASYLLGTYEDEMILVSQAQQEKERSEVLDRLTAASSSAKKVLDAAEQKAQEAQANITRKENEVVTATETARLAVTAAQEAAQSAQEELNTAKSAALAAEQEVSNAKNTD